MQILLQYNAEKQLTKLGIQVRNRFWAVAKELGDGSRVKRNKFKKVVGTELYELRVKTGSGIFRGLCVPKGKKLILLSFFRKKTNKIPIREINLVINRYKGITQCGL